MSLLQSKKAHQMTSLTFGEASTNYRITSADYGLRENHFSADAATQFDASGLSTHRKQERFTACAPKLLDELGNIIPRVDLSDNSALRMQSGLISTPFESMNVTELSINHQYSRLQHIEEKIQDMVGPKARNWKEQRTMLQYIKEADDLNLSSSESLLRDEGDSFIIDLIASLRHPHHYQ